MPYYIKRKPKKKDAPLFEKSGVKIQRKTDLVAKLDRIFSAYIRLRDTMPSGYFRCISCGQIKPYSQADCGHFFSRRHMSTRFSEDNCHAECKACNRFSADHLVGYQRNLIAKIGQQRFDLLTIESSETKWYADFELETLIKHYQKEVARLRLQKGIK